MNSNIGPRSIILNGIDTDFFCPADGDTRDDERAFRLLFVGNLTERKGADLLEPIMRKLGPGFELHYTLGLRTKDPLSTAPNMHPMGRLSAEELRQAYRDADALLFPTRLEGFGYAAAEAIACGTPVIATDCSAVPEVVQSGHTGVLCAADDIDGFARAAKMLSSDPALLHEMGQNARADALDRFSLTRMSAEYDQLLGTLVDEQETARLEQKSVRKMLG
jgi:glycosyltransferase involved in cell wall biosynthesis